MWARKTISPPQNPRPTSYYSHGVLAGPCLYTAGQTSRDPHGNLVGSDSITLQAAQALRNLNNVLNEAGMTPSDIVFLRVFLRRAEDFEAVSQALRAFLGSHTPAITVAIVEGLAYPEYLLEIEAIAAAGDPP